MDDCVVEDKAGRLMKLGKEEKKNQRKRLWILEEKRRSAPVERREEPLGMKEGAGHIMLHITCAQPTYELTLLRIRDAGTILHITKNFSSDQF
jgi:hypothetical protein